MTPIRVAITSTLEVGDDRPLLVIAGPCVIESYELCLEIGRAAQATCAALGLSYIFKASFDKANRTSGKSYRGPGLKDGLEVLAAVKRELGVPVLTDVHECEQIEQVAAVVDVLQIPAFLCRQTDLLLAAAATGRTVNVKKGQFLAPGDMRQVVDKVRGAGNDKLLLTERGTTFGYHNLVVDMRGLAIMRELGVPVVFDATHAVQLPGGQGTSSGGQRQFVPVLLRAALAVGVDGVFIETHPRPDEALSDGPNNLPLADLRRVLQLGKRIHDVVHDRPGH